MLSYPVKMFDTNKFEKKNNISISVTGVNDKGSYVPWYISKINKLNEIKNLVSNHHVKNKIEN